MNIRVTAAVLILLAVLAGVVVGLDRFNAGKPADTSANQQDEQPQVFQFDDKNVTAFSVRSGDTTVRFEKSGEADWKIAGSDDPPNRVSLTSLLIRMGQLKGTKRIVDPGADLGQFGLAQPKSDVTAELSDGTKYTLQVGGNTPTASGTYVKKPDAADVYVIGTTFANDAQTLANSPKEPPTPTPRPSPTATPAASPPATPSPTP